MSVFGQLQTPVAIVIFNRPDLTARVFEEIRRARPAKLFVIADGPRPGHPEDEEKCRATRSVTEGVDWPCEVMRNYAESNLGCGRRPATGISWLFEQAEEAIILEDDCLPHPTFFRYCEELLERYRHDERIMAVCGSNFQRGMNCSNYSYYFSLFPQCTGWASWRRAWQHYDYEIPLLLEILHNGLLKSIVGSEGAARYWEARFKEVHGTFQSHIWDFQWTFACWAQCGLSIIPSGNLISNIGYGPAATHTKNANDRLANTPCEEMIFPLQHPPFVIRNVKADRHDMEFIYGINFRTKLMSAIRGYWV